MLKRILILSVLLCFFAAPAFAGFEEGKAAYDSKNWLGAIANLRPLAEKGDDRAMMLLGNMYAQGLGVMWSTEEALSLYKRAAVEKNNAEAMTAIGAIYSSGRGIPRNLNLAKKWFERSAKLGDPQGAFFYATILFQGNQSPVDDIKPDVYNAYKWYRIAEKNIAAPEMRKFINTVLEQIKQKKLQGEEAARADKEVNEWRPADAFTLGPVPSELLAIDLLPLPESPGKTPSPAAPSPK